MKIQIVGEITDKPFDGCFCPQDLKELLEGVAQDEPLEVEITSEGGSVFAGVQIANMLARWKGEVTTHGVGFVASIATVIMMAGKKVVVTLRTRVGFWGLNWLTCLTWKFCQTTSRLTSLRNTT